MEYLIRTRGSARFLRLVDSTGIETLPATAAIVYGVPFSQLEASWLGDVAQREGVGPLRFASVPG